MKSAPTIAFDCRPSRRIGLAAALMAVAAVLAVCASALPPAARGALALAAIGLAARALHAHLHPPFQRIAWRAAGWRLIDAAGQEQAALLLGHARIGGLLALDFRHGARARFRPLLLPDNLDAETRRRLILTLARGEVVHAS